MKSMLEMIFENATYNPSAPIENRSGESNSFRSLCQTTKMRLEHNGLSFPAGLNHQIRHEFQQIYAFSFFTPKLISLP